MEISVTPVINVNTLKGSLKLYVKSKHGNITYPYAQYKYKTTLKKILNRHTESVHGKISNPCDQCKYKSGQL